MKNLNDPESAPFTERAFNLAVWLHHACHSRKNRRQIDEKMAE
jgi:hypothetical protein